MLPSALVTGLAGGGQGQVFAAERINVGGNCFRSWRVVTKSLGNTPRDALSE